MPIEPKSAALENVDRNDGLESLKVLPEFPMMRYQVRLFITLAFLHLPLSGWTETVAAADDDDLPGAGPHAPVAGPEAPPPPDTPPAAAEVVPARSAPDPLNLPTGEGMDPTPRAEQRDSIEALFALARIKQQTGEHREALDVWEQALDQIRQQHGHWDRRNVTALAGMGASHRDLDEYQEAIEHFGQAVYINRMNEGLHDASQLDYLNEIAEIHALRSEWQEAVQLQEYAYYVHQREHGSDSPEILPALFEMADWYQRTGAVLSARNLYEHAVSVIEQHYGDDDIRLVDPLHKLAMTYRFERYPVALTPQREESSFRVSTASTAPESEFFGDQRQALHPYGVGERALQRSVDIQLAHPDVPARERAEALIGLADWYLLFDKWNQAMDTYGQVHDLLREAGWDDDKLAAAFAEPVALEFPIPAAPSPPPWTEGVRSHEGYIDLVYDVTDRGRLRNLDIADANPEGLLDFRIRRAVRAARFRPRFEAGEPVPAAGVTYRHRFVYYTQPAEPAEEAPAEVDANGSLQETAQQDSE